ncbi:MerC domain-containing protein [Anaerosinus massiliensis]|uniref:MerC domain-containing protein n=1 Tax=Massilibacillus massiliensis TaxID=1806837 RepID=UPI000DA631AB|nr:MerC domain-containing protein [Massilibacillus massiliensis]
MIKKTRKKKPSFFSKPWLIWSMLILFFPIGLYLLWKHKPYNVLPSILITILMSFLLFTSIFTAVLYKQSLDKQAEQADSTSAVEGNLAKTEVWADQYRPDQVAFLQFIQDLNQEIKLYSSIHAEYKTLVTGIQKNNTPSPGIAWANIDHLNRRLEQSQERITAMKPPTNLSAEDQNALAASLKNYANFLSDLEISYMLMQNSLLRSDPEANKLSNASLEKATNNLKTIKSDLNTLAIKLNVPLDVQLKYQNIAKLPELREVVPAQTESIKDMAITDTQKASATPQSLPQGSIDGAPGITGDVITIAD